MPNLPSIPLPRGFAGQLLSAGNCLDCTDYVSLYLFTGLMDGPKFKEPITLAVHQGKACGGFRRRFAQPEEGEPDVTPACDEQGSFVGAVPGVVSQNREEVLKGVVKPPSSNPMLRRRNTDDGTGGGNNNGG